MLTSARCRSGVVNRRASPIPATIATNPVTNASSAVLSAMLRTAANATPTSRAVTTAHGGFSTGQSEPSTSSLPGRNGSLYVFVRRTGALRYCATSGWSAADLPT